jgi:uncharacterized protein YxjI
MTVQKSRNRIGNISFLWTRLVNMLNPLPQPLIVTEPRFVVQQPTTLKLSEEYFSFSGDDFTIVDPITNLLWFKVDGKCFSFKQKKVLLDRDGVPICNLQQKVFSFTKSQELYKGSDGPQICDVQAKFTFFKTKITANIVNLFNGQNLTIFIKGNWMEREAVISIGNIKHGGVPIAHISRSIDLMGIFFAKDTYFASITPGVDAAFIVMLCVAIDEICRDNK